MLTYILRASTFLVYIKLYHLFSTILDTKPWERFLGTVKTKITFIMLTRFCLLSKKKNIHPIPPPSPQLPPTFPHPVLNGQYVKKAEYPTKIKFKIHALFTLYCKFWRYFLWQFVRWRYSHQIFYFVLFLLAYKSIDISYFS